MTTLLKTRREQMEQLLADMDKFAGDLDGKDGGPSAEDTSKLLVMGTDLKKLMDEVKAADDAGKNADEVRTFLGALSKTPSTEQMLAQVQAKGGGGDERLARMTLGEAFTSSKEYESFIRTYAREGVIPNSVKRVQSEPVHFKDLVTGASSTSAGAFVQTDRYGPITDLVPLRPFTIRDVITVGQTTSDTIEYVRVTGRTNNASPVVEASATGGTSGTKPESALALEVVSTIVKTIAHWIPLTKRAIADAGQVRTLVDTFLRDGLREEEEDQIISGDGSGENFTGLLNHSIQTQAASGTNAGIEAVANAIRKVQVIGRRRPNAFVVHPNDWFSSNFLLAKDANNNYILGDPRASIEQLSQIWGLRVVVSEAVPENTGVVGDWRFAVLWDREQASISVSDNVNDFFIRNLVAVLAESRMAFGVLDPQAFCTVTSI